MEPISNFSVSNPPIVQTTLAAKIQEPKGKERESDALDSDAYSIAKSKQYAQLEDRAYFEKMAELALHSVENQQAFIQLMQSLPIRSRQLRQTTPTSIRRAIDKLLHLMETHPILFTSEGGQRFLNDSWLQVVVAIEEERLKNSSSLQLYPVQINRLLVHSYSSATDLVLREQLMRIVAGFLGSRKLDETAICSTKPSSSRTGRITPNSRHRVTRNAKMAAIEVANLIEGYEQRTNGIRNRVHLTYDRPDALVERHIEEFASGRRNFVFVRDANPPPSNYKVVMLYVITALKQDRKRYHAEHPRYIDVSILEQCNKQIQERGFCDSSMKDRYLFEVGARQLIAMEERVRKANDGTEIGSLLKEFHTIYRRMPNFNMDLTVCTCLDPRVFNPQAVYKPVLRHGIPKALVDLADLLEMERDIGHATLHPLRNLIAVSKHCPPETLRAIGQLKRLHGELLAAKKTEERKKTARSMLKIARQHPGTLNETQHLRLEILLGMPDGLKAEISKDYYRSIPSRGFMLFGEPDPVQEAISAFSNVHQDFLVRPLVYDPEEAEKQFNSFCHDFAKLCKCHTQKASTAKWKEFAKLLEFFSKWQSVVHRYGDTLDPLLAGVTIRDKTVRQEMQTRIQTMKKALKALQKNNGVRSVFCKQMYALLKEINSNLAAGSDGNDVIGSAQWSFDKAQATRSIRTEREELAKPVCELGRWMKKAAYSDGPIDPMEQCNEIFRCCQQLRRYLTAEMKEHPEYWAEEKRCTPLIQSLGTLRQIEQTLISKARKCALETDKWDKPLQLLRCIAAGQGVNLPEDLPSLKEHLVACRRKFATVYSAVLDKVINHNGLFAALQKKNKTAAAWSQLFVGQINESALGAISRVIECVEQKGRLASKTQNSFVLPGVTSQETSVVGRLYIPDANSPLRPAKAGEIVVLAHAVPETYKYAQASAVIMEEGGIFSHAAIDLSELGIPAVIGVDRARRILHPLHGKFVSLSMDENGITIKKVSELPVPSECDFAALSKELHGATLASLFKAPKVAKILATMVEAGKLDKEVVKSHLAIRQSQRQGAWARFHATSSTLEKNYLKKKLGKELAIDASICHQLELPVTTIFEQERLLRGVHSGSGTELQPLGDKGQNLDVLQTLLRDGKKFGRTTFTVPPFARLPSAGYAKAFFSQEVSGGSLQEQVLDVLKGKQTPAEKSKRIATLMKQAKVDAEGLKAFFNGLQKWQGPLIVRSSHELEDQATCAAAGLFKSVPNVNKAEEFVDSVVEVWKSAFSERAIGFLGQQEISDWENLFAMSVVVQKYVAKAGYSGVAFSVGKEKNWDVAGVQAVSGLGGGVDGKKTPTTAFVDTQAERLTELHQPGSQLPISVQQLKDCASLTKFLEEAFGCPVEIEFAGSGDTIAVVQVRPITRYC